MFEIMKEGKMVSAHVLFNKVYRIAKRLDSRAFCEVLVRSKCLHNTYSGYFWVCYPFNLKGICGKFWHQVVHQEVFPIAFSDPLFYIFESFSLVQVYKLCVYVHTSLFQDSRFKFMVDILWNTQNTLPFAQHAKKNGSKFSH